MLVELEKRHFNVDEYYRLAQAGVLKPDDRVELIEGEIIKMSPIGSPHAACVSRLNRLLQSIRKLEAIVAVQNPVRLSEFSEPVPDIALLKPRKDFYASQHPMPADVRLVIEVGETSAVSDRAIKLPLYARSEIPEVWLINLPKKCIEVYAETATDSYRALIKYKRGEIVKSETIPMIAIAVNEILG